MLQESASVFLFYQKLNSLRLNLIKEIVKKYLVAKLLVMKFWKKVSQKYKNLKKKKLLKNCAKLAACLFILGIASESALADSDDYFKYNLQNMFALERLLKLMLKNGDSKMLRTFQIVAKPFSIAFAINKSYSLPPFPTPVASTMLEVLMESRLVTFGGIGAAIYTIFKNFD